MSIMWDWGFINNANVKIEAMVIMKKHTEFFISIDTIFFLIFN